MRRQLAARGRRFWIALAIGLLLPSALAIVLPRNVFPHPSCGDCDRYLEVAQQPFIFTASPWGYRVLVPYAARGLADLTGVSIPAAYYAMIVVSFIAVNAIIVVWFSQALRFSLLTATLLSLLYIFSHASAYHLWGYQIGTWEHLFLLLGFVLIYHRRDVLLLPILFLGALTKESLALLVPLYFLRTFFAGHRSRAVAMSIVLGVAFLVPFAVMRSGIPWRAGGSLQDYASYYTPDYFRWQFASYGGPFHLVPKILAAAPVTLPLGLIGFWRYANRTERLMALIAPLALLQFVLSADVERLVALAFPGVLLMIAVLYRHISALEQVSLTLLAILVFLAHYHLLFNPMLVIRATGENPYNWLVRPLTVGGWSAVIAWYLVRTVCTSRARGERDKSGVAWAGAGRAQRSSPSLTES
jgi:hypothetical protein